MSIFLQKIFEMSILMATTYLTVKPSILTVSFNFHDLGYKDQDLINFWFLYPHKTRVVFLNLLLVWILSRIWLTFAIAYVLCEPHIYAGEGLL